MLHVEINPKVEECYANLNIEMSDVPNIVIEPTDEPKIEGSLVYYVPPNYKPKNYVFAFDLDDTLAYHEKTLFVKHSDDIHLIPNRLKKLQEIFKLGYTIVVFSNQATMKPTDCADRFKRFLNLVKLPVYMFGATKKDSYRKPEIGMWKKFLQLSKLENKIRKLYFCGDALGREKKDFSDSDKVFAINIGATVIEPEMLFSPFEMPNIEGNKLLVMFVGSAGSHKTTLFNKHFRDCGFVHVNKDTLKTREKGVFLASVKANKNIVVDNTNPQRATREEYEKIARENGYRVVIFYFVISGYNYNKHREKPVPDIVYHTFFKKLEVPTKEEGELYIVY